MSSPIEVEQIWSRDGNIELVAALDEGTGLSGHDVVLALRERPEIVMNRRVQPHGSMVSVVYSAEVLALACPDGKGCWDAYLEADTPDGRIRLRMGRHRDDIADKKKIMVYPGQLVRGHRGHVVVRPRYTTGNHVSIDCLPWETT